MPEIPNLPPGLAGTLIDSYRVSQLYPDGSLRDGKVSANTIAPRAPIYRNLAQTFATMKIDNGPLTSPGSAITTAFLWWLPARFSMVRPRFQTDTQSSQILGYCWGTSSQIGDGLSLYDAGGNRNPTGIWVTGSFGAATAGIADADPAGPNSYVTASPPLGFTVPATSYTANGTAGSRYTEALGDWQAPASVMARTDGGNGVLFGFRAALNGSSSRTPSTFGTPDPSVGYLQPPPYPTPAYTGAPVIVGNAQPYYASGNLTNGTYDPSGGWGTGGGVIGVSGFDFIFNQDVVTIINAGDSLESSQGTFNGNSGVSYYLVMGLCNAGIPSVIWNEGRAGMNPSDYCFNAIRTLQRRQGRGVVFINGNSYNGVLGLNNPTQAQANAKAALDFNTNVLPLVHLAQKAGFFVIVTTAPPLLTNSGRTQIQINAVEFATALVRNLSGPGIFVLDQQKLYGTTAGGYFPGYGFSDNTHITSVAAKAGAAACLAAISPYVGLA